nr:MAG TPA: hypothetical protein [Caudoviricetes sp.]
MKKETKETYIKGEKIRRYKAAGRGSWSCYKETLSLKDMDFFRYAATKRYVTFGNDAPRGGKLGEYIEVVKDFTRSELEEKKALEIKARDKALSKVLKSTVAKTFTTISDIGSIKIDGTCYSNFDGDGENTVEVCECDFNEFKTAKILTRRQVFSPKFPITIVKFDEPKTIEVSRYDCDDSFGSERIDNACGFVIWSRKVKVFIAK